MRERGIDWLGWGMLLFLAAFLGFGILMSFRYADEEGTVRVISIESKPHVCPHCGKALGKE